MTSGKSTHIDRAGLEGLQYLKELNGDAFTELDRKFQRRISELEVTGNIIRAGTPPAVKFNVFARLNQGGMPLNAQEIRNAIFPGKWRLFLRKMAESRKFLAITEQKIRTERQQDMEMVLRFVAIWQIGQPYRRASSQTLDEFLNDVVEKTLVHWTDSKWSEAEKAFFNALNAAQEVFGKHAFRKISGYGNRSPINRGLFEAQMIVFGDLSDDQLSKVLAYKDLLIKRFTEILRSDEKFGNALSYGTGSGEKSNTRIGTLRMLVREILNA